MRDAAWKRWIGAALLAAGVLLATPAGAAGAAGAAGPTAADTKALEEATRLNTQAVTLHDAGRYDDALPLYQKALAIREKTLGPDHTDLATSLNNLAMLYQDKGDYARAESLYERAFAILEKALGPEHPDVATVLNSLGLLDHQRGDYARAEPRYQRALAIREKALGPDHVDVAQSLNNLGGLYNEKGDPTRAEPLYKRALAIREKALGADSVEVAQTLNNLAVLYDDRGEHARAEPLHLRSLAIREKAFGPDHPLVAVSLNNLAQLYDEKGDHARAEQMNLRALAIREKTLGDSHPDLALTLNNLAFLYRSRREYDKAEQANRRALAIWEKALGPNHTRVAVALDNLAQLYDAKGEYSRAEPLYQRAIAIQEKALGPDHPDRAISLSSLALLYQHQGDLARAEALYRQALAIREKLGFDHYDTTVYLRSIATVRALAGDPAFVGLLEQAEAMNDRLAMPVLATGSEEQKRLFMEQLKRDTESAVSFHFHFAPKNPAAIRLALATLLRRKGRILDAMTDTFASLRRHFTPDAQSLLDRLTAVDGQLATQISRGQGRVALEQYRRNLASLEAERQGLETRIGTLSAEFHADQQLVELDQVQAAVPEGAVLLELVHYSPVLAEVSGSSGEPRYAAYLLRRHGDPSALDLGEAAPIDAAVQALRKALGDPNLKHDPRPAARALDALVMQPLRALLGDTRQILLSPDGELALVPFEALADEQGRYLVERWAFTYLTAGRDLLRFGSTAARVERPLLIGDPAFDATSGPSVAGSERSDVSRGIRSVAMIRGPFERLKSTADEVKDIAHLFRDARVLLGPEATEGALKAARAPLFLHLSTHGFFLPEQLASPRELENPLLRSGILLAGADQRQSGGDDGILTALEASNLDLHGTRLVVLATCDSGLGEAISGEGVYGLRRALIMAGAETQVMSLWEVSSGVTRSLMASYYAKLAAGEGRSEAMRHVELEMLAHPETAHPHLWAAFIVSGSSATLDGKPASADRLRVGPGARGCGCSEAGGGAEPGAGGTLLAGLGLLVMIGTARKLPLRQRSGLKRMGSLRPSTAPPGALSKAGE